MLTVLMDHSDAAVTENQQEYEPQHRGKRSEGFDHRVQPIDARFLLVHDDVELVIVNCAGKRSEHPSSCSGPEIAPTHVSITDGNLMHTCCPKGVGAKFLRPQRDWHLFPRNPMLCEDIVHETQKRPRAIGATNPMEWLNLGRADDSIA